MEYLGNIDWESEEVNGEDDNIVPVIIGAVIIAVLIVGLVVLFIFYRPSAEDQKQGELQDLGSPTRYKAGRGPLGPQKVPVSGRMDRPELPSAGRQRVYDRIDERRERDRDVRRAPPRPKSMGPPPRDVRRAPPAPDHLRQGGRRHR